MGVLNEVGFGIDVAALPGKAGQIQKLLFYYEGLEDWQAWAETVVVPLGTEFFLAVKWANIGTDTVTGHVDLAITKPDLTEVILAASEGQDYTAPPAEGRIVAFEPFTIDQDGDYVATVGLKDKSTGAALDRLAGVVVVSTRAAAAPDIWDTVGSMMAMMLMMAMASMVSAQLQEAV